MNCLLLSFICVNYRLEYLRLQLREVIEKFTEDLSNVQVPLSIKIWRVPGCHELLSSLGFDLMGVGREEVVLRSGRSSLRRPLQCALQSIIDLFGRFILFFMSYSL